MTGQKLNNARQAAIQLIDRMGSEDRLAIITFSNGVQMLSPLVAMNDVHKNQLKTTVAQVKCRRRYQPGRWTEEWY
jgi:Ca-activated chloride channel homolog